YLELDGVPGKIGPENASDFQSFLNTKVGPNHKEADHTLNFRIDSISAKNSQKFNVTVKLDVSGTSKDLVSSAKLDVIAVRPLEIRLVPIKFISESGSVFGPPDREELETPLLELVEGCFPIRVPNTVFTWQPPMTVEEDKSGCPSIIDDDKNGKSDV